MGQESSRGERLWSRSPPDLIEEPRQPGGQRGVRKLESGVCEVRGEGHIKSYSHCKDLGICKDTKPLGDWTWKWHEVTCLNKIAAAWEKQKLGEQLGVYCNTQVRKSQMGVSQIRTVALKGWVFGSIWLWVLVCLGIYSESTADKFAHE